MLIRQNFSTRLLIGEDKAENLYFLVNKRVDTDSSQTRVGNVFSQTRVGYVYKYNRNHELVTVIGPLDNELYMEILKPLIIDDDGNIYHLTGSPAGAKLTMWSR